ncbi:glucoamylase family protein [Mesorhizobium humile]|uniref:Glucoamylase family protein n=1 Tax=Mesorhizobium humile TaxID=3072313 RepID=A0ABU4YPF2_9HYPH|nr:MULTISPECIES: glucoamylase family protein [unclassified Mesorhizobium]MDX8463411.1 glucoamylase family protein [Mesorhizobium sp. VK2D]MDX8488848.1 glucoamylase family protein [Mesorhizobium sp. VK2B]
MPPPTGRSRRTRQNASLNDLLQLQRETFDYFLDEANPANGLIRDKTAADWPASIAVTGLALACYPVAVERGFMSRRAAAALTLSTLRFFWTSPQGPEPDGTGYRGFYYHFLDMQTGRRAWRCELSTIDSALLLAGALAAAAYFDAEVAEEQEIRMLADALYRRADWKWAQNQGATVTHGWTPEGGFIKYRWEGYDEALLLYILGLGSPTHPLPESSYAAWTSTYRWESCYGYDYLYAGPLFTHQLSHAWIDFRGIQDAFMREKGIDYFENSRRATYLQQCYATMNPRKFEGYGECCWGITASEGPGPATLRLNGIVREFYDYVGRGVPYGPDDGTLAPWAVAASLPFAPEIVLEALDFCIHQAKLKEFNRYGFKAAFNPTHPGEPGNPYGWWVSPWHFGINQGPIVLMIENYLTDLVWRLMRACPYVVTGLRRAGFEGGWLDQSPPA